MTPEFFDKAIEKQIRRDPIEEARQELKKENLTKEEGAKRESAIGFCKIHQRKESMEALMVATHDTYRSMEMKLYLEVAQKIGFRIIQKNSIPQKDTHQYILFHKDGIIMICTDYQTSRRVDGKTWNPSVRREGWENGKREKYCQIDDANIYFNLAVENEDVPIMGFSGIVVPRDPELNPGKFNSTKEYFAATNHLNWANQCKVGSIQCIEGLKFKLKKIKECGKLMNPWVDSGNMAHGLLEKLKQENMDEDVKKCVKAVRQWETMKNNGNG